MLRGCPFEYSCRHNKNRQRNIKERLGQGNEVMQLRILGCSGGISPGQGTTAFLVDDSLLIDAGTGVEQLEHQEMRKIKHLVLTHAHLDHISHLPFMLNNVIGGKHHQLQVYGLKHTIDALKHHIFNNVIWPDFTKLPTEENPCVRLNEVAYGDKLTFGDKHVVILPVEHAVPTAGVWVGNTEAAFAFSGDTSRNDGFWAALNNLPEVDMLIMDNQYLEEEKRLSHLAKHYYASALLEDLDKLTYQPKLYLTHLPPYKKQQVIQEALQSLASWQPQILHAGDVFKVTRIRLMTISKQHKRYLHGSLIALVVFVMMASIFQWGGFRQLEWVADDFKTASLRADKRANDQVIVLLVDEASLSALDPLVGRWPWPRSVWADVLEYLTLGGAKAAAFDILFTERMSTSGEALINDHDLAFVEMTRDSNIATHAIQLLYDPMNPRPNKPLPEVFSQRLELKDVQGLPASQNNTYYIPFKALYEATRHVGVVEFQPDVDGVYRRTNLFRDYLGHYYPVLSTATLLDKIGIQRIRQDDDQSVLYLDDLAIPLDRDGHYQVNFYEHFESFSVASVLASVAKLRRGEMEALYTDPSLVTPEVFQDKVVFIGTSAVGLEDMKSTPMNARWPGVFLHASIASNILEQDFVYQADQHWTFLALFLAASLTALLVLLQGSVTMQIVYPMLLAGVYAAFNIWLQYAFSIQLELISPVLTAFITWLLISAYLSATEGREKKRVKTMLAQYVSPAALTSVLDHYEDQIQAEVGKEEEMSIVFSDVRSFTTISEGLKPAEVVKLLNIHLDAMTQITFEYGGTMDKFIGDATMAFWGAPLPDDLHALHATQAAIHMHRAMERVNQTLVEHDLKPIAIGVGVNTGKVILGNIGSSQKLDYTVIGDAVNLGSRLEGLTKQYGVGVLISEFTQSQIGERIPCALIDLVRVKGKLKPVKIYYPLADEADDEVQAGFELVAQCQRAFDFYHARQFEQAQSVFEHLPDEPFATFKQIYVQRCEAYIESPPPVDWDGVFTLTTK